jgi:hypothetical protein
MEEGAVQPEGAPGAEPKPALSRAERRARATADALRTLVRDTFADRFGGVTGAAEIPLQLRLVARPGQNWELDFSPPLADQIAQQIEDAQAERAIYRKGFVYCYRCESSDCEHASPPSPLSVFGGYDSAGRPEWTELAQALIARKDPRVDRLYARPPAVVAALQLGSEIRGEQLSAFGRASKTYAVLGQVIAGYFPCTPAAGEAQDQNVRLAVTLQLVETRGPRGEFRLHLNPLAGLPDGGDLDLLLGTGWEPALHRARQVGLRDLEALEFRVRAAREQGRAEEARELLRQVPALLRRLADGIERGERQGMRRTRHVEMRREDNRPVHKAVEDARDAKPDCLFYDLKAHTFVVTGPKGRTHAFSADGRHVTSFLIRPDAIDFRLRTERWRRVTAAEADALRAAWSGGPPGAPTLPVDHDT